MIPRPILLVGVTLMLLLNVANAQKAKLRITSILDEPYLMRGDDGDEDKFVGFCEDLAEKISEVLDQEHEIHIVKDGKYGARSESGDWSGMIGELINNEADMAIAPLTVTELRARYVDFSTPFQDFQLSILVQEPPEEEDESEADYTFLLPFHGYVWAAVAFSLLGLVFVSLIVEWSFKNPETHGEGFITFLRQDSIFRPESLTGKVIRTVFLVFVVVIIGAYTASLAAQRMADSEPHAASSIDSIEELVKEGDEVSYGILANGSTEAYFKASDQPIYNTMLEHMRNKGSMVSTYSEGLEQVREGDFAFLIESPKAEYFTSKEPCDLISVDEEFGPSRGYAIATPKGSPYSDHVNLAILKLKEDGELEELIEKWWNDGACAGDDDEEEDDGGDIDEDDFDQLNLNEMAGLFYFLFGGLILIVIVYIIERRATGKSSG